MHDRDLSETKFLVDERGCGFSLAASVKGTRLNTAEPFWVKVGLVAEGESMGMPLAS